MRINADDFGLDKSVSTAIYKLASANKIDSISVIVNTKNFDAGLLRKVSGCGVSIGVHFNLVSGEILSKTLSKQLNSKEFLGEDFWLLQKDIKSFIPGIKQELEAQRKKLSKFANVTYADYHTVVPFLTNTEVWEAYKGVCIGNKLKFRGSVVTTRYINRLFIFSFLKVIQVLRFKNFYKILFSLGRKYNGSYFSDYSLNCWGTKMKGVVSQAIVDRANNIDELIVHVADPDVLSKDLFMYKNKCSQFEILLAGNP